jgi:hypothetical protein
MKIIKEYQIWPNYPGMIVEKTDSDGKLYRTIMHKEEYELEYLLNSIEQEGIINSDQMVQLRKLIDEVQSLKYSLGVDSGEVEW